MKIATWNVNSIRARLPHLENWLNNESPDVVGIQETKAQDHQYPLDEIKSFGYHSVYFGQKSYNGTAILSKEPAVNFSHTLEGTDEFGARFTAASFKDGEGKLFRFINVYVINGKVVNDPAWINKLAFIQLLSNRITQESSEYSRLAVVGDFNIAPADQDVYDPQEWQEKILCSTPEREALLSLCEKNKLTDCLRVHNPDTPAFTWWDYRMARYRRKQGIRIDHILLSEQLSAQCTACYVDENPRKQERPSDHAPVIAVI